MKRLQKTAVIAALGLMTSLAHANEARYNQVSFDVNVTAKVANDQLSATLTKSADHTNAKTLANTLNTTTNQALTIAKKYPDVKVTTGRHNTYPRYDNKGKMNGFTGSASINIESQNFEQASELIAELQSIMTLENLNFSVSDATKRAAENDLKTQVIKRFGEEADSISQAFGANGYKIVSVQLNNNSGSYSIVPMMAYGMTKEAAADVAQPRFESGDSSLAYTANGTIELNK